MREVGRPGLLKSSINKPLRLQHHEPDYNSFKIRLFFLKINPNQLFCIIYVIVIDQINLFGGAQKDHPWKVEQYAGRDLLFDLIQCLLDLRV